jgi:hypothetical protein
MTETVVYEITGQIGRSGPGNPPTMVLATVERAGKTKDGTAPLHLHSAP